MLIQQFFNVICILLHQEHNKKVGRVGSTAAVLVDFLAPLSLLKS